MRKCFIIISTLVTMLLVNGCIGAGSGPPPVVELAVINHEMTTTSSGDAEVKVAIKNVSSVVAELAEVTVNFYDAEKNLINSSSNAVINLKPRETWDFKIACQGSGCSRVQSYEIETMAGTSSGGL